MTEAAEVPVTQIDVNADLGEGFGRWSLGDDEALLDVITSANVACGFHAGDPTIMRRVCRQARERGVVIGAQVSYRDLAGFGRRPMSMPRAELTNEIVYQIGGLQACARAEGTEVRYVKPHGALNNVACVDLEQSAAIVDAVLAVDPTLALLVLPGSQLEVQARTAGLHTVGEAFPDRAYEPDGQLRNRSLPDAVLHDVDEITRRAVGIACDRAVETSAGAILSLTAQSLCLHGDNEAAVQAARSVVRALREAGVQVSPFVRSQ
ncbi:MAG: 5-oxoprolinase subunit PxpA [Jatrophihabitans sp.]